MNNKLIMILVFSFLSLAGQAQYQTFKKFRQIQQEHETKVDSLESIISGLNMKLRILERDGQQESIPTISSSRDISSIDSDGFSDEQLKNLFEQDVLVNKLELIEDLQNGLSLEEAKKTINEELKKLRSQK